MATQDKTSEQLLSEIEELRERVRELEATKDRADAGDKSLQFPRIEALADGLTDYITTQ